jgi:hypothetical protein
MELAVVKQCCDEGGEEQAKTECKETQIQDIAGGTN